MKNTIFVSPGLQGCTPWSTLKRTTPLITASRRLSTWIYMLHMLHNAKILWGIHLSYYNGFWGFLEGVKGEICQAHIPVEYNKFKLEYFINMWHMLQGWNSFDSSFITYLDNFYDFMERYQVYLMEHSKIKVEFLNHYMTHLTHIITSTTYLLYFMEMLFRDIWVFITSPNEVQNDHIFWISNKNL